MQVERLEWPEPLERLIGAVQDNYQKPNHSPFPLSSVGQSNKELLAELKEVFGSIKAAVRAAGENHIRFVGTTVGREAVASRD
ncbi:hypothetical protein [Sphingomonas hengshuiensis]|uniref:Uncharacterized protein n=1 Tax=Sphingomonas hengshuiensis TaxID=1609977 RepID=A0A7U4LEC0_9SPHN|nr:hypothetical protein [Sphingomonas hengshuiensis]AJP71319.1 hypothetical protein TS85_05285 [Sphingomonas hengshuiensis]